MSPLVPPIQAQPKVGEWIELYDRGVITKEELRHQLTLATAQSLSSPSLQQPVEGMVDVVALVAELVDQFDIHAQGS